MDSLGNLKKLMLEVKGFSFTRREDFHKLESLDDVCCLAEALIPEVTRLRHEATVWNTAVENHKARISALEGALEEILPIIEREFLTPLARGEMEGSWGTADSIWRRLLAHKNQALSPTPSSVIEHGQPGEPCPACDAVPIQSEERT